MTAYASRLARAWLFVVAVCLATGCYGSHRRPEDAGPPIDVDLADVGVPCGLCAPLSAPLPIFRASFNGHFDATGPAGVTGIPTGTETFVAGAPGTTGTGGALWLPNGARIDYPGTGATLASARALTISMFAQLERSCIDRAFLSCRSGDRGFESYRADVGADLTTCAGDGSSRVCGTVPVDRAFDDSWTHFILRWAGPGSEPEVASNCGPFRPLRHTDGVPVSDVFDGAGDLVLGGPAHGSTTTEGDMAVDELRIYDVVLPERTIWVVTACGPS